MKTAIKINDLDVLIPADWSEITFGQHLSLKTATNDIEILHALTGIELQLCEQVPPDILQVLLMPVADLITEPLPEIDVTHVGTFEIPLKIGKKEFARKVNCDVAYKKFKDEELILRVVSIYLCPGIEDEEIKTFEEKLRNEKLIEILAAGKIIGNQLIELAKSEALIKSPEYKGEEFQAGINEFKKYGVIGLVRGIALRWGISKDDVFRWTYNDVLLELKISADENNYQRKLSEILSKKK